MDLQAALAFHRLVAIVRGRDAEASLRTVLTLAEEGVELIEVSLTGKDALTVIERARKVLGPGRPLGAGTVLSADDARAAHRAGADFAVTPGLGDAFAAGFLAGLLRGLDMVRALRLGHITAVSALGVTGDHGPLPDGERIERLLGLPEREWLTLTSVGD